MKHLHDVRDAETVSVVSGTPKVICGASSWTAEDADLSVHRYYTVSNNSSSLTLSLIKATAKPAAFAGSELWLLGPGDSITIECQTGWGLYADRETGTGNVTAQKEIA